MSVRLEQSAPAEARPAAARAVAARRPEVNFERLRAPFSLRCGALLVDYIIPVGVVAFATLLARAFGDGRRAGGLLLTVGYVAALAVALLNLVVVAGLSGRTLGKWVAGLRIERRDGVPLSFGRALLRHLVGYPLTLLTLGVGFLLAAFSAEGRALHDLLAGTVVVRSRRTRG
ncbi:MAG TPA: RDD family protein [Pyrinomonadaceae bacterium]|nr:RDD family protein [Pyrinomonadaceae bacterium]